MCSMAPDGDVTPFTRTDSAIKGRNPLQRAIIQFASTRPSSHAELVLNQRDVPKRFTRYGSLLLLGPTFLTHTPVWEKWYGALSHQERSMLFEGIAKIFPGSLTHIAANAPIAPAMAHPVSPAEPDEPFVSNVMRSPTGFLPLHGDFGPCQTWMNSASPSSRDFEQAYWAESGQLRNIVQVWAPRWTMFSRGNISEKARILQDGPDVSRFPGLHEQDLGEDIACTDVVDFYVGIGYFAFCYLSRGIRRVWGWDINGWSIEALKRGCLRNGWNVKVVRITDDGHFEDSAGAPGLVTEIMTSHRAGNDIRCIAFWGDNAWAATVMKEIMDAFASQNVDGGVNVRHCNLGLLPTSEKSWKSALSVLGPRGGWLHVHENVEIRGIDSKAMGIAQQLQQQVSEGHGEQWAVSCEHVEEVKTYAPGVMHCVFDIKVSPPSSLSSSSPS